jgi:hypothetical protein
MRTTGQTLISLKPGEGRVVLGHLSDLHVAPGHENTSLATSALRHDRLKDVDLVVVMLTPRRTILAITPRWKTHGVCAFNTVGLLQGLDNRAPSQLVRLLRRLFTAPFRIRVSDHPLCSGCSL